MRIKAGIELEVETVFSHDGLLSVSLAESVVKKAVSDGITTCGTKEYMTAVGKVKVNIVIQWTSVQKS